MKIETKYPDPCTSHMPFHQPHALSPAQPPATSPATTTATAIATGGGGVVSYSEKDVFGGSPGFTRQFIVNLYPGGWWALFACFKAITSRQGPRMREIRVWSLRMREICLPLGLKAAEYVQVLKVLCAQCMVAYGGNC